MIKLKDALKELEVEAWFAGPEATAEFDALHKHFRRLKKMLRAESSSHLKIPKEEGIILWPEKTVTKPMKYRKPKRSPND